MTRRFGAPSGWGDLVVRALKTAVVGFVALVLWDWLEAGDFDPIGVASNAAAVTVGLLVVDAILMVSTRSTRS
jgi:hypothetical protein